MTHSNVYVFIDRLREALGIGETWFCIKDEVVLVTWEADDGHRCCLAFDVQSITFARFPEDLAESAGRAIRAAYQRCEKRRPL